MPANENPNLSSPQVSTIRPDGLQAVWEGSMTPTEPKTGTHTAEPCSAVAQGLALSESIFKAVNDALQRNGATIYFKESAIAKAAAEIAAMLAQRDEAVRLHALAGIADPISALAKVREALKEAVEFVGGFRGYDAFEAKLSAALALISPEERSES